MQSTPPAPAADPPSETEIAAVLLHQKKLLRLRNWLCSPLLRLPKETIIHILSYIMDNQEHSTVWKPIINTCHHIYSIMRSATELWWKVDCRWAREAHLAFMRSKGSPRVLIAELHPWNRDAREFLDHWKEKKALHGHRLHRMELFGYTSDVARFKWIFEEALPCLKHLKIHFSPRSLIDPGNIQVPIALPLPTDVTLQTLDLRNTMLPWSSNLFNGLSELHLDFRDCGDFVQVSEDELLTILGASPLLESLSLLQVGPRTAAGGKKRQSKPERVAQYRKLTTLELENSPAVVGHILSHIDAPAITSLQIRSPISSWDLSQSLNSLVPNRRIQKRLFSDPSVFEIETTDDGLSDLMILNIGTFKITFDFDLDDVVAIRDAIMACIQPLVPLSVTHLKLDFSETELEGLEWADFLNSHSELRSIECLKASWDPEAESLWDALSPSGPGPVTVCQKLDLISIVGEPSSHLLDCLLSRKNAGFELERLRVEKPHVRAKVVEEFGPLVGKLEIDRPDDELGREVCPVSMKV